MPFVRRILPIVTVCWLLSGLANAQVQPAGAQGYTPPSGAMPIVPGAGSTGRLGDPGAATRELVEVAARMELAGSAQELAHAQALYCSAAREGDVDALMRLGWLYANGRGVKRNDMIARTLFKRAGSLGSDRGERLAQMLPDGKELLPGCLRGPGEPSYDEPEELPVQPVANGLPTPTVESPAQFRDVPPSPDRRKLVEMVTRLARQFMLDPRLVLALIQTESGFDPNAKSVKNAQGLMQLIPDTAERFAVRDMLDPLENLRGGMSYLRWLLAYFRGDVVLTLAAYNAGEGAVDKFKGVPPFAETLAYVQKIRSSYPLDWHPFDATATAASPALTGRAALRAPAFAPRGPGG